VLAPRRFVFAGVRRRAAGRGAFDAAGERDRVPSVFDRGAAVVPFFARVGFVRSVGFSRVGHAGLMQSVHGGRPASIAVTTGDRQTGHGGWSFSSFPRWGSGYVTRQVG
jgi:hypothetical protein